VKSVNYPVNSLTIPKLKKGAGYEFRVVAENVQGDSEPLLTTDPVIAENPFSELLVVNVGEEMIGLRLVKTLLLSLHKHVVEVYFALYISVYFE